MKLSRIVAVATFLLCFSFGAISASPRTAVHGKPVRSAPPALEVIVLGSGGPRAFGRAGSSYVVLLDGTPRVLVDAGPGAFVRIGELQLDLSQVDTVLLTHLHIDHSSDLPAFFNARARTRRSTSTIWRLPSIRLKPKSSTTTAC